MRTGHYLKGSVTNGTPAAWVSVVVTPHVPQGLPAGCTVVPSRFGQVTARWTRLAHGRWSEEECGTWDTAQGFWDWLERWNQVRRRAWVVCPVASDALTYLGFWDRIARLGARYERQDKSKGPNPKPKEKHPGFLFRRLVMRGKPDIVEYSFNQRTYTWVSVSQFWPSELSPPSTPESSTSPSGSSTTSPDSRCTSTPQAKCAAILTTMRSVAHFWSGLNAGGFGRTIGGMSWSFLKSRSPQRCVSTHTDIRVQKMERLACHGGRASTWFFGDCVAKGHKQSPDLPALPRTSPWHLEGELYHVDVSSMYPYLMTCIDMPTSLISYPPRWSVEGLAGMLHHHEVVANVQLDTPVAEYPHRYKNRVIYPTGRFNAVLCGAELRRALADGHIAKVLSGAVYTRGRPFAAAAQELLKLRADAKKPGNEGWETFLKLLGNSSTGKLAQRSAQWEPRPKKWALVDWGEWPEADPAGGAPKCFRAREGMVEELVRDAPSKGTVTACYAHITSAGREMMRRLREGLPPRSVVSQDTDGMWVTRAGLDALRASGALGEGGPGRLRLEGSSDASRWYSPKHYYARGHWVLSGMHNPAQSSDGLSFWDEWTSNLARSSSPKPPDTVHLHARQFTLNIIPQDGTVGPDGWQIPYVLPSRPKKPQVPFLLDDDHDLMEQPDAA